MFHIPYHPAAAGQVEGMYRTMISQLRKGVNAAGSNWGEVLPLALMCITAKEYRATRFSPKEALMARTMWLTRLKPNYSGPGRSFGIELADFTSPKECGSNWWGRSTEAKVWCDATGHVIEHQVRSKVMTQDQAPYQPLPKAKWYRGFSVLDQLGPSIHKVDLGSKG